MEQNIIIKFTIATPEGINTMQALTKAIAHEKFSGILGSETLQKYIDDNYAAKELKDEMNSMSNQWLTVYADDIPAGFARITSKGARPEVFKEKRLIRIADFGILRQYDTPAVRKSLFTKCLGICQSYDGLWAHEYAENPLIDFFEKNDFIRYDNAATDYELPLKSVFLVRDHVGLSN